MYSDVRVEEEKEEEGNGEITKESTLAGAEKGPRNNKQTEQKQQPNNPGIKFLAKE